MKLVIQNLVFLELSDDDIVDPDAAIREMEHVSSELEKLNRVETLAFIDCVKRYADEQGRAGLPNERVEFIRSIPEAIGLIDEMRQAIAESKPAI